MGKNDDLASSMLGSMVGALRGGSSISNRVQFLVDSGEEVIASRIRRNTGHAGRSAAAVGRSLGRDIGNRMESAIEEFADRRLDLVVKLMQEQNPDIVEPTGDYSIKLMRGSVEKWMEKAGERVAQYAKSVVDAGGDPEQALVNMRNHTRTVARSAANAAHNAAVLAVSRANPSIVQGVMSLATLDGRTTELCIGRHGGAWDIQTGIPLAYSAVDEDFPGRPPWHFNCRTVLTPILFAEDVPDIQDDELDQWFESRDAKEALGEDRLELFKSGRLTRVQLINGN